MNSRADLVSTRKHNFTTIRRVVVFALLFLTVAILVFTLFFDPLAGGIRQIRAQEANPAAIGVAQGSAFTYQGQLHNGDAAANGQFDFRFRLFNAAEVGSQIGGDVTLNGVTVSGGLFTVALDFGATAFAGEARWLAVEVKPAGAADYTLLTPCQALTAAPYALYALNGVPGPQGPIGATGAQGPQGLQGIQGLPGSADAWSRTGNAGTNPASNFLGTTDNQPLEIRINNQRVFQFVPGSVPNLIGGYFQNSISPSTGGNIIAGGGGGIGNSTPYSNSISAGNFSTISGGAGNLVSAGESVISGGLNNFVGGGLSVIGGGSDNSVPTGSDYSTVGGGNGNVASGLLATISGGSNNSTTYGFTTIGGGSDNHAELVYATVGGGTQNTAQGAYSVVPGGAGNEALGDYSFAAGRRASANNPGVFVWADSTDADFLSTGSNQFVIRATGGMGVGTNGPQNQLHVIESISGDALAINHVAQIQNLSDAGSADVLALRIQDTVAASDNNFITFFDGTSNEAGIGAIEGNGTTGISLVSGSGDYAEWLPKRDPAETIARGEVVGLFGGQISHQTTGADRVMAISTGAIVAGNDPGDDARDAYALVAFIGQIEIQVRGVVQAGDFIVPSGLEDGTAVAVAPEATASEDFKLVVGQAWQSSSDEAVKPILTVVGLAQQDPTIQRLVAQVNAQEAHLASLEARLVALETLAASE